MYSFYKRSFKNYGSQRSSDAVITNYIIRNKQLINKLIDTPDPHTRFCPRIEALNATDCGDYYISNQSNPLPLTINSLVDAKACKKIIPDNCQLGQQIIPKVC